MFITTIPSPSVNPEASRDTRVQTALREAQRIWQGARELEQALSDDPTLNPEGRKAKLSSFADQHGGRVFAILDKAHGVLRQDLQKAEKAIDATLQQPRETFLGSEFRRTIAEMKPEKRKEILEQALKAGPEGRGGEVLGSVFKIPPWLLGLTQAEVDNLRNRWTLLHCKDTRDRIEQLNREMDTIRRAGSAFQGEMSRLREIGKKAREAIKRTHEVMHPGIPFERVQEG